MLNNIRNFCILAHIDHGKSTLADRFLELTGTVEKRKMHAQFLDQMELEQEKGITIKMQPVRMSYKLGTINYQLNLIDTPGHVDFSYEVSRALACVEGAILLVDATQGVQAQTVSNLHLARAEKVTVIPVVNKIDLPVARIAETKQEIAALVGVSPSDILACSGKTGAGVPELLAEVIRRVSQTALLPDAPLRARVFDSSYDAYQGVIAYVRIVDGTLRKGDKLRFIATAAKSEAMDVGFFRPHRVASPMLQSGDIGYIATGVKEPEKVRVGDTVTGERREKEAGDIVPLAGYKEPQPVVFASIFPTDQDSYENLRDALTRLRLEDSALAFEPEESGALGRGFRAGFLGMLHMEIVAERLRREYALELVFSRPSVAFRVTTRSGPTQTVFAAHKMPPAHVITAIEEPWCRLDIITPPEFIGALTGAVHERRGYMTDTATLAGGTRILMQCETPLGEIIVDFYDRIKGLTRGYASLAYELIGYRPGELARLNILVAGEEVSAFSEIVPKDEAERRGRNAVGRLKELLPRELFAVSIQAETGGRIVARETIPALKKDVTGYLYGGDRTRKMKLWKKQKEGKKKLKTRGRVEIPQEVFFQMLKK